MTEPTHVTSELSPATGGPDGGGPSERHTSLWGDAWRELRRRPLFLLPAFVVVVILSIAAFPGLWTSRKPDDCDVNLSKLKPSGEHIFGMSELGCDYFAQTIYGAQPSIIIAVTATTCVVIIGGLLGTIAGYYGGWFDALISRITDIFFGLPFLLGAVAFLALMGVQNIWAVAGVLIVLGWTSVARIMRASVLSTRGMDYVQAARALGASNTRIIFRHILPNAMAPVVVVATIALGGYVAAEATLSYLGVGLQPPDVSWGIMISDGQSWVLTGYPHLLLFPGVFLVATVLSFILLGDALRDALDPKLR